MSGEETELKYLQKITVLLVTLLLVAGMVPTVFAAANDNGVAFTEVNETVYATTAVNVRTGPAKSFKKIGMLGYGEGIQRIGIGANGWSKVFYKDGIAYIHSDYLSKSRPARIDSSELTRQISIAGGLREANFTAESWAVLTEALEQAREAVKGNDQKKVDECTAALEEAIAQLTGTNRGTLRDSLEDANEFVSGDEKRSIWMELVEAITQGKSLLGSNDQTAIDAASEKIDGLLAKAEVIWEDLTTPVVVPQEVPVEVPPTDDYCNIPGHRVWPVVCICSLVLNVALGAVIVVYVYKKKNQKDDTPLVDYDISDDIY